MGETPDRHGTERARLVRQLRADGIHDLDVLDAIGRVRRHELVPAELRDDAYIDAPLPIGWGQTISQPYIVALMTELLHLCPGDRVLDVGTGSGYQAAILAELGCEVHSIERIPELADRAGRDLARLGYDVAIHVGDGAAGWPAAAPFDAIVVTAAAERVPERLVEQLRPGGRMVVPVGSRWGTQSLELIERSEDGTIRRSSVAAVRFVPLIPAPEEPD